MRILGTLSILILLSSTTVYGQSGAGKKGVPSDTSKTAKEPSPWTKTWGFNVNGNQAFYRDWSEGGVNSLAFSAFTDFRIRYTGEKSANTSRINLRFGQTRLQDTGLEKTEDMIRVSNKTEYFLTSEKFTAFGEVAFRTQFAKGFHEKTGELISEFMSPGFITESLGLSWQPGERLSAQGGMALRQTIVRSDSLSSVYGIDDGGNFRSEGGIDISIEYSQPIFENFTYNMELNTFTNLLIPVTETDVIMFNRFTGEINSFMSSMLEISFMYDNDFSSVLQIKQMVALGFNIQIL